MLSPRNRIITMAIPSILSIVKNGYDIERICEYVQLELNIFLIEYFFLTKRNSNYQF